ncbi:MAG: PilZ domain-containing protein [Acidobacteria bacterium]|nr:PilZ domain-containing protein [Acidobacteriota bacterium]MBV9478780.1 PilZ domain-containing protein [Acidobacteriota bacterium]
MLNRTLTLSEVSQLLELPTDVVEGLLDSGRVLCRMQRGEARVPLAQLETFLRDALVRVYRAEAGLRFEETAELEDGLSQPLLEESAADASADSVPDAASEAASDANGDALPAEETPAEEPHLPIAEPAFARELLAPRRARPRHTLAETPDMRSTPRFIPLRRISGIFGDAKFSIVQISQTGLRIRHAEPLVPGVEAKLSFALLKPARSFVMRARVVWTSLARSGDETFSISGLRIIEHADRLARAVELLNAAHELQPDRRAKPRRTEADSLAGLDGVSDEEIALVTSAVQKFASDPVEASRWYSRARFALSDEHVRRVAPIRQREEVLGIWEYLERQIDIAKIAGVVLWMRDAAT